MASSPIEEIKHKLDIADLISGYVRLQRAGVNFKALCPFHKEKTPSFFVSPARQTWHCFGCSQGGDHFSFVQKIENVEFIDALKLLAQKTGVELKYDEKAKAERSERAKLLDICEVATRFFEKQLEASGKGKGIQEYLLGRGLRAETLKDFRVGFAPETGNTLYAFLRTQGYPSDDIEKAGLVLRASQRAQSESSGDTHYRDRFRGRIMFPIFDHHGSVVGFTGRIFGRETSDFDPKYLNTPQSALFDKGKILFGFDRAKNAIREKGNVVLVEGQMDCVMAHQAGTANIVATSGTALTEYHLTTLKRLTDSVIFAFDMDRAGEDATRRGFELALQHDLSVRIVTLPQGKDPAELIANEEASWHESLERSTHVVEFFLERAAAQYGVASALGKKAIAKLVLPVVSRMANAVEQAHWVGELSRRLAIPEDALWQELKKTNRTFRAPEFASQGSAPAEPQEERSPGETRRNRLEEAILILALRFPETREKVAAFELLPRFSDDFSLLLPHIFENQAPTTETLALIESLQFKGERDDEIKYLVDNKAEIEFLCKELKKLILQEELQNLELKLGSAERGKNEDEVNSLVLKINEVSGAMRELI